MPAWLGLRATASAYQLNPRAAASAKLWPASDTSAKLWADTPAVNSATTNAAVRPTAHPILADETAAWLWEQVGDAWGARSGI